MPTASLRGIFLPKIRRKISICSSFWSTTVRRSRIRSIFGFCSIYLPKHLMSFAGSEQQEARRLNESAGKTARADGSKSRDREAQEMFALYKLKICIDC